MEMKKIISFAKVNLIVGFVVILAGCGGNKSTKSLSKDGRIYWQNSLPYAYSFVVSYFDDQMGIVETTIAQGKREDVSHVVIKGGTEITLDWGVFTIWAGKIKVTVDGDVIIYANQLRSSAVSSDQLEYTIGKF